MCILTNIDVVKVIGLQRARGVLQMAKDMNISLLLDFYGEMLTEKQREAIEFYYNEDLSLSEISDHLGISRQGVRDNIKRAEAVLLELEDKLGLAKKFGQFRWDIDKITTDAKAILFYIEKYPQIDKIAAAAKNIIKVAQNINI